MSSLCLCKVTLIPPCYRARFCSEVFDHLPGDLWSVPAMVCYLLELFLFFKPMVVEWLDLLPHEQEVVGLNHGCDRPKSLKLVVVAFESIIQPTFPDHMGRISFATPSTLNMFYINGIFRNSVPCSSEHVLGALNKLRCSALANQIIM